MVLGLSAACTTTAPSDAESGVARPGEAAPIKAPPEAKEAKEGMTPDDIAQRYLDFDPATFRGERRTVLDAAEDALLFEDFHGIACRTPATVGAGETELPVIMAQRSTGHRAWQVPRDAHVLLLLAHLPSRQVWVGLPFYDAKLEEYPLLEDEQMLPVEPTGPSAESLVADVQRLDAAAVMGQMPPPGPLRVAMLEYDTASNLSDVVLEGAPASFKAWPIMPTPGTRGLRTFVQVPAVAEPPTRPGLTWEAAPGGLVVGRVVVEAEPFHILDVPTGLDEGDGIVHSVRATIPLTLLLVGSQGGRVRLDLGVPVFGSGPPSPGDRLEGGFVLEPSATWEWIPEGSLVWAWLEGALLGPWPLTLDP